MLRLLEADAIVGNIQVAAAGDSHWHPLSDLVPVILFEGREGNALRQREVSKTDLIVRARQETSPVMLNLLEEREPPVPE